MIVADILNLIPQRPPFVMVGTLLRSDAGGATTSFTIEANNVLVSYGYFTEAGLLENMAQTAAAHAGYNALGTGEPVKVGYIGAVKNLEIHILPKIGDELITEIKIENRIFDVTVVLGKVMCNHALVATAELKIFIQP